MRWSAKLSGALLPIFLAASAASAQLESPSDDSIAAIANGKTVMTSEVRERMREILDETGATATEGTLLQMQDQALTDLISKRGPQPEERVVEAPEGEAENKAGPSETEPN